MSSIDSELPPLELTSCAASKLPSVPTKQPNPPPTTNSPSDNESDDEESWQEMNDDGRVAGEEEELVVCLFCDRELRGIQPAAVEHLREVHGFDLAAVGHRFQMDCYGFIKMVNYIRSHKAQPEDLLAASEPLWTDEKYLKPVVYEEWLMFDYDVLLQSAASSDSASVATVELPVKTERQHIADLVALLQHKDSLLEEAARDIQQLRTKLRELFDAPLVKPTARKPIGGAASATDDDAKFIKPLPEPQPEPEPELNCVSSVPVAQDVAYFSSYAHYGIHHEMLSDEVRTSSYRDAIIRNAGTFRDRIVLDLGCGTSILSMFAARTGAKRVIAVDQSDIIYKAMDIVRNNGIENIAFVKGRLEDTAIPVDKVDVIVSEWMGYFLLFEGMLDSVIYARNHYLAPGGVLLPNRCTISLAGVGDEARYAELIEFWDSVYGFDMRTMRGEVLPEASVEVVPGDRLCTEPQVVSDLDLMLVAESCMNFEAQLELRVLRTGKMTALCGYFDTFFELPEEPVMFSTGPAARPTHWKQTLFYLPEPVAVTEGEVVRGQFKCRRDRRDVRALYVKVEIFGQKLKYYMN